MSYHVIDVIIFPTGTRLFIELKYLHKQNVVNINRGDLASAAKRGGIQASNFRRSDAEWANNNESNWTDYYTNNTFDKQYEILPDGIVSAIKNTFEKENRKHHLMQGTYNTKTVVTQNMKRRNLKLGQVCRQR